MNKTEARIALGKGKKVQTPNGALCLWQNARGNIMRIDGNRQYEFNKINCLPDEGWSIYIEPEPYCSFCGETRQVSAMMKGFGETYICNNCKKLA